jgi:hypothetical protein
MAEERKRLYYSISEVSELIGLKAHILRFWESEFPMLRPRKNRAGNRAYTEREAVLRLHLLKGAIIDFARQDAVPVTSVQIYAEQELEDRLGHFFDALVYYIVCGYEKAMRRAVRYA